MRVALVVTVAGCSGISASEISLAKLETMDFGGSTLLLENDPATDFGPRWPTLTHDCVEIPAGVSATFADQPVTVMRGGPYTFDGHESCADPDFQSPLTSPPTTAADAPLTFHVWDAATDAQMTAVGVFATRSIRGSLVAGAAATLQWLPATDTILFFNDGSAIELACDTSAGTPLLSATSADGTLVVAGSTLSFQVPPTTYRGQLSCRLTNLRYVAAGITACDFATCQMVVWIPLPFDVASNDNDFQFSLSI